MLTVHDVQSADTRMIGSLVRRSSSLGSWKVLLIIMKFLVTVLHTITLMKKNRMGLMFICS